MVGDISIEVHGAVKVYVIILTIFGCWLSSADINTQQSSDQLTPRTVASSFILSNLSRARWSLMPFD